MHCTGGHGSGAGGSCGTLTRTNRCGGWPALCPCTCPQALLGRAAVHLGSGCALSPARRCRAGWLAGGHGGGQLGLGCCPGCGAQLGAFGAGMTVRREGVLQQSHSSKSRNCAEACTVTPWPMGWLVGRHGTKSSRTDLRAEP